MKKQFWLSFVLLTLVLSLLPVSVFANNVMPRVGFMVRWQEHGGRQPEASNLEDGSTLEAYTDLYESVFLKPYIEGVQYPPGSIGWSETTYYTWEL